MVSDLTPLKGMPLADLRCGGTRVSDLMPLKGMSLTVLGCNGAPVSDLSPLKGMPLTELMCNHTPVSDLSPLEGMPLTTLRCSDTGVSDLSPLKDMPLKELQCDFKPLRDTELLRSLKTLETINEKPAAEFWKEVEGQRPPITTADNVPPAGFKALFNGQDLTGWKGLIPINVRGQVTAEELERKQAEANEKVLPHWTVRDGVLHYDGQGQSLQTVQDFTNFELLVDWKIAPGGDSGIYLRGSPQLQIWDRPEGSGGLYNNQKGPNKPLQVADKPVGEWNTFRIVMVGEQVTVYLNDVLVVDKVTMENHWERSQPIYSAGPIELQHHSSPLEFKNIFIKELP